MVPGVDHVVLRCGKTGWPYLWVGDGAGLAFVWKNCSLNGVVNRLVVILERCGSPF